MEEQSSSQCNEQESTASHILYWNVCPSDVILSYLIDLHLLHVPEGLDLPLLLPGELSIVTVICLLKSIGVLRLLGL